VPTTSQLIRSFRLTEVKSMRNPSDDVEAKLRERANTFPVSRDLASILASVDAIAREIVAVDADAVDRDARWPERAIRALQAAQLGGLVVPEVYGGRGQGLLALVQICEILGKECASTAICFGMHCVGASVIARNANKYQQERYLAPINAGRHITTLSFSEAGTGAHSIIHNASSCLSDRTNSSLPGTRLSLQTADTLIRTWCQPRLSTRNSRPADSLAW